ncbi:MAG: hypothetical protein PVG14_00665 [Anaerolineales bacterium]|jgi:hypothetical protein
MTHYKRYLTITLAAIASLLVFLGGFMTASGGRAIQLHEAGPSILTNAQWAAVQASNSLLMGGFSLQTYLPLVFR